MLSGRASALTDLSLPILIDLHCDQHSTVYFGRVIINSGSVTPGPQQFWLDPGRISPVDPVGEVVSGGDVNVPNKFTR